MIEIRKNERTSYPKYQLWLNDKCVDELTEGRVLRYSAWITERGNELNIYDELLSELIVTLSPTDLKNVDIVKCWIKVGLSYLQLFEGIPNPHKYSSKRNTIKVIWNEGENTFPYCYFYFDFDFQKWAKSYSYQTYKKYLSVETRKLTKLKNSFDIYFSSTINRSNDSVRCLLEKDTPLQEQIFKFAEILKEANKKAIEKLEAEFTQISLKEFNFPREVRTSCEQYLLYFADFLKEIGVSAVANIEHDKAGKTLFTVKPDNPQIALDAIREALEIYLELPMSPLMDETEITDSRILVLRAEINTLKSRLDLAQMRQIEIEKITQLQSELIATQRELFQERDMNGQNFLRRLETQHFETSIVRESAIDTNIVEGELIEENKPISNKEIDMGLITMKPAKVAGGVEVNTPRLARLGIKKVKQLFDYLDDKLNSEAEK